MAQLYGRKRSDERPKALECGDEGDLYVRGTLAPAEGADLASETTLGTVKDRLGALLNPAAGSLAKLLTDILARLPATGAATESTLAAMNGKLLAQADANTPYLVLCGKRADGTITPLKCDSAGRVIMILSEELEV